MFSDFKKFSPKTVFIIFAIILSAGVFYVLLLRPQKVHFHAGFHVYDGDILSDFSGDEYMHVEPCSEEKGLPDHKIDLHDHVGDIVHVHRSDAKWKDLFNELKISLDSSVKYYLNGAETPNLPQKKIAHLDRVLVQIGSSAGILKKLQNLPEIQKIAEQAGSSETCGD